MGRASSSEDSTSNHDELDRSQSYQNHFFDALRKNPDMGEILDEVSEEEKTAYYTTTTTSRLVNCLMLIWVSGIRCIDYSKYYKYWHGIEMIVK